MRNKALMWNKAEAWFGRRNEAEAGFGRLIKGKVSPATTDGAGAAEQRVMFRKEGVHAE